LDDAPLTLPSRVAQVGVPVGLYALLSSEARKCHVIECIEKVTLNLEEIQSQRVAFLSPLAGVFYQQFSFLFLGYKKHVYWWELMVLGRKAFLSLIAVSLAFDLRSQAMIGLATTIFSMTMHAYWQPFTDINLNRFEMASLVVTCATFFLGVFTLETDSSTAFGASILALIINLCYALVGFFVLKLRCSKIYSRFGGKLKANNTGMDKMEGMERMADIELMTANPEIATSRI
jgi:hypothetical protein